MSRNRVAAVNAFTDYAKAFETLDPQAVIPHYHEPCMFISPQGVAVMANQAQIVTFFAQVMEGLRVRGYGSSTFLNLQGKQLSDILAVVSGVGVWLKTDGDELQRFGLTYTLRNVDGKWRIIVATVHDIDTALQLA
jgi:ketosteroid isomerase-like protein